MKITTVKKWDAHGYTCEIVRMEYGTKFRSYLGDGHWCGYVYPPHGHPWHGADRTSDVFDDIEVMGGVGSSGWSHGPGGRKWRVGFDTASFNARDWTLDQVVDETERLALQAAGAAAAEVM